MGFPRQEYCSGLPFPSPGDLPNPGIKTASLTSPAFAAGLFTTSATWAAQVSVQFSCSVVSDSLQPHGLQHTSPSCPSPTPRAYSNSCPSHQQCHPTISRPVVPFSSHLQSFPASVSFQMSRFFASGGQSIRVSPSSSVLPMIPFRID